MNIVLIRDYGLERNFVCGMNTWHTHLSPLLEHLGHKVVYIETVWGVGCKEALLEYLLNNSDSLVIISREADWLDLLDVDCNKWYFAHNAYCPSGFLDYVINHDEQPVPWEDFKSTLTNVMAPSKYMQRELGGIYVPQPYFVTNKESNQSKGILMIGDDHDIKRVNDIREMGLDITVLSDATPEEVREAIQTHTILIHNSMGEGACYALLECNGSIPIYVNEDCDWHHSRPFKVNPIKMTKQNIQEALNNPCMVSPDEYKSHAVKLWDEFLKQA